MADGATTVTLDQVKDTLTTYKSEVETLIETKAKEQSDAANAEIAQLTTKLAEIEKGLEDVRTSEERGKTFGLPGLEYEKDNWSWQRFFRASMMQAAKQTGHGNIANVSNPWKSAGADFEERVVKEYTEKRIDERSTMYDFATGSVMKTQTAEDGSGGGFLIPPEIYQGDIIEPTYAQTPILQMPVLKFEGLHGDLPIPRDTGNLTAYWVGEGEGPTKSTASFEMRYLRRKKLGVFCKISQDLLRYSNRAVDAIIKNKMSRDASVELSNGLTNGTGSASQPKGLTQYTSEMTSGPTEATNGGRINIDRLWKMKMKLAAADELRDTNTYGALMRPEVLYGILSERVINYSGQSTKVGMPVLPGGLILNEGQIAGPLGLAKIGHTTQLSAALTKGSSSTCSQVYLGDWSMFAMGMWADPVFRASDVAGDGSTGSAFLHDEVYLVMFMNVDCNLLRGTAFTYSADAETSDANW